MVPCDVYAQDSKSCIHKPDHRRDSPVAYFKVPFVEEVINFTGGELVSGQEKIEHNFAYPVLVPAEILY